MWDSDFDCPVCHNSGYMRIPCPDCWGSGKKPEITCYDCGGSGVDCYGDRCWTCGGDGVIREYCDRCDGGGEINKECPHCRR